MAPLTSWTDQDRKKILGVFTDIDDTLTDGGRVASTVYDAMERLRRARLLVIPITGRPAGWCDMIARTWPVDAVVGENGAFYFRYDCDNHRMIRRYMDPPEKRADDRHRLNTIRDEVLSAVPGAAVAADQPYRETDLAIDFAEDVPPLRDREINKISYDKLSMTQALMADIFDTNLDQERHRYVFVGDSPNDSPMFGFFPAAVGVANLLSFTDRCDALPRWITDAPRGEGFCELAEALLAVR
jgi:hydroxymethylpyrimidine pyrophosphatase-like HAD family hydrolase